MPLLPIRMRLAWAWVAALIRLAAAAALLVLALDWRSPTLAAVRTWALAGLIAVPVCLIVAELRVLRAGRGRSVVARVASLLALMLAVSALTATLLVEGRFRSMSQQVLLADPARLERVGRHLIVGYNDLAEVRELARKGAVAGIFLGAPNVRQRSAAEIRQELRELQDIRRQHGLPLLWVATDQEGGGVSRLSPPLERLPAISAVVADHPDAAERRAAVSRYATAQARALADLGVNLNLAPVVDLNHRIVNPSDRYTRIHQRAISTDAGVVTEVAGDYCAALASAGVRCSLKHFPGLGRVVADTHVEGADLDTGLDELAATDWVPFRALMNADTFTMLGHARLVALDGDRPASFSAAVVAGLLRGEWHHDGVLITDDFTMGAVYRSRDGLAGGAVAALNAGVDLILLSYDPDQVYPGIAALLAADAAGQLRHDLLERSDRRLSRSVPVGAPSP